MPDFWIKKGDREPRIEAVLRDANRRVVNLTAATGVRFLMKSAGGGAKAVAANGVIVDASAGHVAYSWGVNDTDTPDLYHAEWEVTWTGGSKQTFPSDSYNEVRVLADLG